MLNIESRLYLIYSVDYLINVNVGGAIYPSVRTV